MKDPLTKVRCRMTPFLLTLKVERRQNSRVLSRCRTPPVTLLYVKLCTEFQVSFQTLTLPPDQGACVQGRVGPNLQANGDRMGWDSDPQPQWALSDPKSCLPRPWPGAPRMHNSKAPRASVCYTGHQRGPWARLIPQGYPRECRFCCLL